MGTAVIATKANWGLPVLAHSGCCTGTPVVVARTTEISTTLTVLVVGSLRPRVVSFPWVLGWHFLGASLSYLSAYSNFVCVRHTYIFVCVCACSETHMCLYLSLCVYRYMCVNRCGSWRPISGVFLNLSFHLVFSNQVSLSFSQGAHQFS